MKARLLAKVSKPQANLKIIHCNIGLSFLESKHGIIH